MKRRAVKSEYRIATAVSSPQEVLGGVKLSADDYDSVHFCSGWYRRFWQSPYAPNFWMLLLLFPSVVFETTQCWSD